MLLILTNIYYKQHINLRRPARGGSTTATTLSFDALLITEERISSALPEKNVQLFMLFSTAFCLASLTASSCNSNPKTWPQPCKNKQIN